MQPTLREPAPAPVPPLLPAGWLQPRFTSPRVAALMTARSGGVSAGPYAAMNLGLHVGDDAAAVAHNRAWLQAQVGMPLRRLVQVHGTTVHAVETTAQGVAGDAPQADAAYATAPGIACEIQVADCLPVLFAHRDGKAVGAAHAGWRGLAGGVLEHCLAAMCQAAQAGPADFEAWLGPCIGPGAFEVGADVLQAFGADVHAPSHCFRPRGAAKWLADLPALARSRLLAAGVPLAAIAGNDGSPDWCTVTQSARWFSFRRDGATGRMAALIWLRSR